MYIQSVGGYDKDGQQYSTGKFLAIFSDPFNEAALRPELRAVVRPVRLEQMGHWMMGHLKFAGYTFTMSGTYGSDGLPCNLNRHVIPSPDPDKKNDIVGLTDEEKKALWALMVPLPAELQTAFWEGGGHNSAGKEGPSIHKWGKENIKLLEKQVKRLK